MSKTPTPIDQYLDSVAGNNDALLNLLQFSVGRTVRHFTMDEIFSMRLSLIQEIEHIADWLKAVIIKDDAWLQNIDDLGRPKKLMKFSTIAQIVHEADKAMLKAAQRLGSVKLMVGDEHER